MTHKVKRGLISIVMAAALVISVLAGVLPVQSIKVGAETEPDYLTFTAEEDNSSVTVNLYDGTLQYSVNNVEFADYTSNTPVALKNGDTVRFRGDSNNGKQLFAYSNSKRVTISGKVACSGNIMTLLNYNDPDSATMSYSCFSNMFNGCTGLTSAPELPATALEESCYADMFNGCTGLTSAPELPATALADFCYGDMFNGCTGLTSAPKLPATTLADGCYYQMFYGCTDLTEPPELPATTLKSYCYRMMFNGCTNIELSETKTERYNTEYRIPSSGTGTDAFYALNDMFDNTGGSFKGTPDINKTYYIHKEAAVTYTIVEAKPATYEADGNIEYYIGSDGNYYTYDGTAYNKIEENSWVIPKLEAPDDTDYLTFTAEEDNSSVTLNLYSGSLEYSKGDDAWAAYTNDTIVYLNNNETVRFRGDSNSGKQLFDYGSKVTISGRVACSGNIMTLLDYNDPDNATMGDSCFLYMFNGCTGLTSAPALPATTLARLCYDAMFSFCTGLTEPPALPATTLEEGCYNSMFTGCTGLTEPPALPATTLAESCYRYMFYGCTGLTSAPALPATTLAGSCYNSMFHSCINIKLSETKNEYYNTEYRIPSSGTGTDAVHALEDMFVNTGGTFTGTPDINKTYYIHKDVTYTPVPAKAATYEADGNSEYYKGSDGKFYKSEDDGATFIEIKENSWIIPRLTPLMQVDTDSSNGVDVNICAPLPEGEDINDYSIQLGDTVQPFNKCSTVVIDGKTYYLVKVTCPAKHMADKYAYAVQENGTALEGASGEVSVRDYADYVIGGDYTAKVKKICRAMLAYGASAQIYFNYNTEDPANKNNREGDGADYSGVAVPENVFYKDGLNGALVAEDAPVEYVGMSLTFEHDTYISLAFKVKSGTQEQAMTYVNQNFTFGGNPVSAEKNGTQFVVIRQKDISVKNLVNNIALGFGNHTYTVNATQYMTLANAGANENLKNVCKALYNYYTCVTEQ